MKKLFLSTGFIVFALFLFTSVPKASAFFVSALPKVAGYKIAKDYGINLLTLGTRDVMHSIGYGSNMEEKKYVLYIRLFHPNAILNEIKNGAPSGANACLSFRVSREVVSCEYVKIVSKK